MGTAGSFAVGKAEKGIGRTHFHLIPRLKMSGALPSLPVFIFMAGIGTPLRVRNCRGGYLDLGGTR